MLFLILSQNFNKQLKLKAELDQKRTSLEASESMQSFLSNDLSKVSPLNDLNNNKVSGNLSEINNLSMINNQIIAQLKANNPLMQIEFVSNYSAIQTSIRNTFGYIRINNQLNSQNINSQQKPEMNYNDQMSRNMINQPSVAVYDYLNQMSNNQKQRSAKELHVDLEPAALQQHGQFNNNMNRNEVNNEALFDYFSGQSNGTQSINTFSSSSSCSSKSTASHMTTSSSGSFPQSSNNTTLQKYQQKPIGTSQSCYDTSTTSPISITTDNLQIGNCLASNSSNASSSNYFIDQFSKEWSNQNGIAELMHKSKSNDHDTENQNNNLLNDDFFNSTMVKNKNSWSSVVNDTEKVFSPFFGESAVENNSSPTLSALLNGNKSFDKLNSNKSNSSVNSNSYFQNKGTFSNLANDDQMPQVNGQKLMSSASSTSASPDERISSLSSSASSACSESNFQDSSLATLKSVLKSTSSNNQFIGNLGQISGNQIDQQSSSTSSNLAVGSSTRSQLRRLKMIYHCKFGEFGINDGQFTEPSGVTINTNNDIIVADTNSHRIQIFDKDGRFKFKFGECGKRDGQLLYPNRVSVVKHTGDIVVTERSPTHQIQIYNKYGHFLRKFGANILQHPRGVCVDNKGRIIVVECKVMRVLIFDLMGNVLQKFNCSKYLEFPNGVCCSSGLEREEIYISDNRAHCIKVFDYNGNFIRQIGGEGITNYPIGVGINSNNEILVADNHNNFNLTVFSQDGQLINALESKVKHAQCFDVGLMDDGSIVLASKDYRIYVYKYVNNNLTLSSSYTNENNHAISNEVARSDFNFEQRDVIMHNEDHLYDLFSPQISDLSNYNHLMEMNSNNNNHQNQFSNKNSDNLLDNLNTFNSLLASN